jgi:hypothetical protein
MSTERKPTNKNIIFYPMVVKQMTIDETRAYHRKMIFELSLKWRQKNSVQKVDEKRERFEMEIAQNGWRANHPLEVSKQF